MFADIFYGYITLPNTLPNTDYSSQNIPTIKKIPSIYSSQKDFQLKKLKVFVQAVFTKIVIVVVACIYLQNVVFLAYCLRPHCPYWVSPDWSVESIISIGLDLTTVHSHVIQNYLNIIQYTQHSKSILLQVVLADGSIGQVTDSFMMRYLTTMAI